VGYGSPFFVGDKLGGSESGGQMVEILTIEQMYEHYRNEWLLIAFTEIDDDFNVLSNCSTGG
jgi:hypothetical protein